MGRLIDEDDVIEIVKFECGDWVGLAKTIENKINALSSEQQWIPCSVRLPEELEEVNVTWINHDPESYYSFIKDKPFTATAVYYKEKWYWYSSTCTDILGEYGENDIDEVDDAIEITAWKPIGEPWKGEQK